MNLKLNVIASILLMGFCNVAISSSISNLLCQDNSNYTCHTVKKNETWEKLFPDKETRDAIMRINRVNISLKPHAKIAIPIDSSFLFSYSPFPKNISPPGRKLIHVSVHESILAWGAYDANGSLIKWGPTAGGRSWCSDVKRKCQTKVGTFTIYKKGNKNCISSKYPVPRGGAPMPYCMYFSGGFAIHGSREVPGFNASHGCVRIFVSDAKWLNEEFVGNEKNVAVIVSNKMQ